MALLPSMLLRIWATSLDESGWCRVFMTWEFAWTPSFRPNTTEDLQEFYELLGCVGVPFDYWLAFKLEEALAGFHGLEVDQIRYNFHRHPTHRRTPIGGNIIEIVAKQAPFDKNASIEMDSDVYNSADIGGLIGAELNELFVNARLRPAIVTLYMGDVGSEDIDDKTIGIVADEREFYKKYIRHYPPQYADSQMDWLMAIEHWCEIGPDPNQIYTISRSPASA